MAKSQKDKFLYLILQLIGIDLRYCLLHLYFYCDKSYQISYKKVTLPYVSKSKMAES